MTHQIVDYQLSVLKRAHDLEVGRAQEQFKWEKSEADRLEKEAKEYAELQEKAAKALVDANKASIEMHEQFKEDYINAKREYGDFLEDKLGSIVDAYTGALSYLNSVEQAAYLEQMALQETNNDTKIEIMEAELAVGKKTMGSEEYNSKFDAYIRELQRQEPEKTLDDLDETLEQILEQNKRLETAIGRSSYQSNF